jgi:hypothetical protein
MSNGCFIPHVLLYFIYDSFRFAATSQILYRGKHEFYKDLKGSRFCHFSATEVRADIRTRDVLNANQLRYPLNCLLQSFL